MHAHASVDWNAPFYAFPSSNISPSIMLKLKFSHCLQITGNDKYCSCVETKVHLHFLYGSDAADSRLRFISNLNDKFAMAV